MIYTKLTKYPELMQHPEQHRAEISKIAFEFVEYAYYTSPNKEALSCALWVELDAILEARAELQTELGLMQQDQCPAIEFEGIDIDGLPQSDSKDLERKAAQWEQGHKEYLKEISGRIKAANMLFKAVCRALVARGIRFATPHEIAARKTKYRVKLQCMAGLTKKSRAQFSRFSDKLTKEQTQELWQGLTAQGFISGDFGTFRALLEQGCNQSTKAAPEPLIWLKSAASKAYFLFKCSQLMQSKYIGNVEVEYKAFAPAFGLTDKEIKSTLQTDIADYKAGRTCRESAAIDSIFFKCFNLSPEQTQELWQGLTAQGFISGDISALCLCLGQGCNQSTKATPKPLFWLKDIEARDYFIISCAQIMRGKFPICPAAEFARFAPAFGLTDKGIKKSLPEFKDNAAYFSKGGKCADSAAIGKIISSALNL